MTECEVMLPPEKIKLVTYVELHRPSTVRVRLSKEEADMIDREEEEE